MFKNFNQKLKKADADADANANANASTVVTAKAQPVLSFGQAKNIHTSPIKSANQSFQTHPDTLTLLLLNTTCPVLANSVDPDQLASEEAN